MLKGVSGQGSHVAPAGDGGTTQALLAEQIRIRHLEKALACAAAGMFRERCETELASRRMRVLDLERTLRMDANAHRHSDAVQMDECLLSAMELARTNGDTSAAEAVAQECLALVEVHCRTLLEAPPSGTTAAMPEGSGLLNGVFES